MSPLATRTRLTSGDRRSDDVISAPKQHHNTTLLWTLQPHHFNTTSEEGIRRRRQTLFWRLWWCHIRSRITSCNASSGVVNESEIILSQNLVRWGGEMTWSLTGSEPQPHVKLVKTPKTKSLNSNNKQTLVFPIWMSKVTNVYVWVLKSVFFLKFSMWFLILLWPHEGNPDFSVVGGFPGMAQAPPTFQMNWETPDVWGHLSGLHPPPTLLF